MNSTETFGANCKLIRVLPQPGDTQASTHGTLQIPLALDTELRFLLTSTNIQINSPHAIETGLLQPFLDRHKKLLLVTEGQDIQPAVLQSLDQTSLTAGMERGRAVRLLRHKGKGLLVSFPVLPQRNYILQTRLEEVYVDRVKLRYQDPRYDARRRFPIAAPIPLVLVPLAVLKALECGQLEIVREISRPTGPSGQVAEPAGSDGVLSDFFCPRDSSADASLAPSLVEELPTLICGLHDISCGGAQLTLEGTVQPEELTQALGLCRIILPHTPTGTVVSALPRTLQPLCVIRSVRSTPERTSLHVRFLRRLPDEFAALFEDLETTSS